LDLVAYHADQAVLVVEVKKGEAEGADVAKHAGYTKAHPDASHVLLVVAAEEEDYDGFRPCTWGSVCIQMRHLAIELRDEGQIMAAAMALAFVAAVEQNLMGFSAGLVRAVEHGSPVFFDGRIVDHIECFVKGANQ
jgi:hypothetical protein